MRIGELKSHIFAKLNSIELGFVSMGHREGIFHATDYAATCGRKQYYDKLKIHQNRGTNFKDIAPLFTGLAIHQALERSYKTETDLAEIKMAMDITTGKKVDIEDLKIMPVEKAANVIVGTLDAVYMIDKNPTIIDYKTWHSKGFPKRAVDPMHEFQVNIYGVMLAVCAGVKATHGAVVYLDSNERFCKPKIFPFKLKDGADILSEISGRHAQFVNAIQIGKLPDRNITEWLCEGYCPYASRCFNEEELSKEENVI